MDFSNFDSSYFIGIAICAIIGFFILRDFIYEIIGLVIILALIFLVGIPLLDAIIFK